MFDSLQVLSISRGGASVARTFANRSYCAAFRGLLWRRSFNLVGTTAIICTALRRGARD
jgi:hypothetical protein